MMEILSSTALNMIQDLGRDGLRRFGVSTAGAMDRVALLVGNAMLANPEGAAGIEVQVFPFELRFLSETAFALTGADCGARLDGRALPPYWTAIAREGQILSMEPPTRGARAYLSAAGGIDVPVVLGSRSTQLRGAIGGFNGRPLAKGDVVAALPHAGCRPILPIGFGVEPPGLALPSPAPDGRADAGVTAVRVIPAAEQDRFDAPSIARFWTADWKITPHSDRYGYRLAGPGLALTGPLELRSHGIVPGVIQVPSSGQPIVQLSDAQTAGGYPKIGTIIEADLWRIGQAPLGSRLRFVETTHAAALAAEDEIRDYVARVRAAVALHLRPGRAVVTGSDPCSERSDLTHGTAQGSDPAANGN